jgi:hypothetical protein
MYSSSFDKYVHIYSSVEDRIRELRGKKSATYLRRLYNCVPGFTMPVLSLRSENKELPLYLHVYYCELLQYVCINAQFERPNVQFSWTFKKYQHYCVGTVCTVHNGTRQHNCVFLYSPKYSQ